MPQRRLAQVLRGLRGGESERAQGMDRSQTIKQGGRERPEMGRGLYREVRLRSIGEGACRTSLSLWFHLEVVLQHRPGMQLELCPEHLLSNANIAVWLNRIPRNRCMLMSRKTLSVYIRNSVLGCRSTLSGNQVPVQRGAGGEKKERQKGRGNTPPLPAADVCIPYHRLESSLFHAPRCYPR